MRFEAVTIKDIAKELGISISSVSKALKDSHEIGEQTKKRVLACAERLNYKPNPIAQSLKRGNSKSIGVIVPTIENNFFSQVINGIESVANEKGYHVIITQTHESYEREVLNTAHLMLRAVDGLLISLSTETENMAHFEHLHTKGLPMVFFDRVPDEIETHKVIADNFSGAYQATEHLVKRGYKRIAHITSSPNTSITIERLNGYKKALSDNNIKFQADHVKYCAHGGREHTETVAAINELLLSGSRPDAILAASDRITTSTFLRLRELNVSIPAEIALVGFTNTQLAPVLDPSLSSVYQPGIQMGAKAMEMLIELVESKKPVYDFETLILPTELQVRNSSGYKA